MPHVTSIARSGRFQKAAASEVRRYTESISFDWRLYHHDIAGSIAHATMLAKVGILSKRECKQIIRGLKQIEENISRGRFKWSEALEDIHMNIEAALTVRVPAAAKLHTARSRNDQIATDMRLWMKDEIQNVQLKIRDLQRALIVLAERTRLSQSNKTNPKNQNFLSIPGYTHLQRAQPVFVAHHLLAYVEMLERDIERFTECAQRADVCPLGSGAIAGTSLPIDRKLTAKLLGFQKISMNSMDAVSDRDFVAEFTFTASLTGIHLSRLAEDFILWSSSEFGFITIGDSYTTGSSLMPQKKNPDIAELGRGKSGRLIGNLVSILTLLKGLPMTYNRDLQEDKEPLFDSVDTLKNTLAVFAGMIRATHFHIKTCREAAADPALLATELADRLVKHGIPFRKAHHIVGTAVKYVENHRKTLAQLTPKEWRSIHPLLEKKAAIALNLQQAFYRRNFLVGAPAPKQVSQQLRFWTHHLKKFKNSKVTKDKTLKFAMK